MDEKRNIVSSEPFRIVPADKVPKGLKRAEFVYDPPLEKWPLMPHQDRLFVGDFVKRDAAGRAVNVSFFDDATHVYMGADKDFVYVQAVKISGSASAPHPSDSKPPETAE